MCEALECKSVRIFLAEAASEGSVKRKQGDLEECAGGGLSEGNGLGCNSQDNDHMVS